MESIPRLKEFLEAFLAPWHVAAGIAAGSALLLVLRTFGISDLAALPAWLFGIVWILLTYAAVVLGIRAIQASTNAISALIARKLLRKQINEHLDTLNDDERKVIDYLVANNHRSLTGRVTAGSLGPLVQKGLLERASGSFSMMEWPHTVPEDVWQEMKRRKEEAAKRKLIEDQQRRKRLRT